MALPQTRLRRRRSESGTPQSRLSLFSQKPSMTSPAPRTSSGPFRPNVRLDPSQVRDMRPKVRGTTLRSARAVRASRGPQPFAWLRGGVAPVVPQKMAMPKPGRSRGGSFGPHSLIDRSKLNARGLAIHDRMRAEGTNLKSMAVPKMGDILRRLSGGLRSSVPRSAQPIRPHHRLSRDAAGAASTQRPARPAPPRPRATPAVRRRARLR